MPIIFLHGVASRHGERTYETFVRTVKKHLRTYVAPTIASDPRNVLIRDVYWGDVGSGLAWHGASCPPTTVFVPTRNAGLDTMTAFTHAKHMGDVLGESLTRLTGQLGNAGTRVAGVARGSFHPLIMRFFGDIFVYLAQRGTPEAPGPIPMKVLTALQEARTNQDMRPHEPLIVLSHSMGGQIIYDMVTAFLPYSSVFHDVTIDFWCACSSQVGLFEEMKLFLKSSSRYGPNEPVPFPPAHLGRWWNVWDPNDFLSYTVHGIIAGVDDGAYDSGVSAADAHHMILLNYSFYAAFAKKITDAKYKRFMK